MHPPYPRAEMERRICEAFERGEALPRLERLPGWPSRMTVYRWSRDSPGFAARLTWARQWRRKERVEAATAPSFNETQAQALLLRVRRGEAVRDLVRRPAFVTRDQLNRWKRERPDFAAELEAAVRFARSLRRPRWGRYDEAVADQIICRVAGGELLGRVLARGDMPGMTAVRRWRAREPGFDHALQMAQLSGHRRRMRKRRRLTPELAEQIVGRIVDGASLAQVGREPDMPHRVTLHTWMHDDPSFADEVEWAQRARDEMLGDQACEIAGAATEATLEVARRRVGEIHKRLGRMAPKRGLRRIQRG